MGPHHLSDHIQRRRVYHQILSLDSLLGRTDHGIDHPVGQSPIGVFSIPVEGHDPRPVIQNV
jgi:hypothetical protein